MKFRVSFKCPDAIYYALEEIKENKEEAKNLMYEWLEYGEYIDIEFDTENGQARLIKPGLK